MKEMSCEHEPARLTSIWAEVMLDYRHRFKLFGISSDVEVVNIDIHDLTSLSQL